MRLLDMMKALRAYKGGRREGDKQWVVPEDEQAWEQLMAAVDAGEDPSTVVKPPKF